MHNKEVIMAIVIHTRKRKYQYAYEHTREGNKVVSRYMYPVNAGGDQTAPYQREVAQQKINVEDDEIAQQREILIGKKCTCVGESNIEVKINPFIGKEFKPAKTSYEIYKRKEDKKWSVRKMEERDKYGVREKQYCGSDTLRECKRYCLEKLTEELNK